MIRSQLRSRFGDELGAISDLEEAAQTSIDVHSDLISRVNLADLLKKIGLWTRAQDVASSAAEVAIQTDDREAKMRLFGVLGQLERRQAMVATITDRRAHHLDEALRYATEGIELALEQRNRVEQVLFRLDQGRILLMQGNVDSALTAADEAGEVARSNLDENGDLSSYGLKCQALMRLGKFILVREAAEKGLAMAASLQNVFEEASFLFDISQAERGLGNIPLSAFALEHSLLLAIRCGRTELLLQYRNLDDLVLSSHDWALIHSILNTQIETLGLIVDVEVRMFSMTCLIETLKRAVALLGAKRETLLVLDAMGTTCARLLSDPTGVATQEWLVCGRVILMLYLWLQDSPDAMEIAKSLDEVSSNNFDFRAFVAASKPRKT
jgi:tetratricopeptide (TPR) repeat protein